MNIKKCIAFILNYVGILDLLLWLEKRRYKNNYIRLVNYHDTKEENLLNFMRQIEWYKKNYVNITYEEFQHFLDGSLALSKPGIMLTFDDGLEGNFFTGRKALNANHMTGYFMISPDLIGTNGYMLQEQIKKMIEEHHIIGSHTCTHHRMKANDSDKLLQYEIIESKNKLENMFKCSVDIFCWCGGELDTYTKRAEEYIETAGYKYGFMTNSFPLLKSSDVYHIQRINIEDTWPLYLVKFQVSGLMDWKYRKKRKEVNFLTTNI